VFGKNSSTRDLHQQGDRMKRIELAETLKKSFEHGIGTYNGAWTKKIAEEIQSKGCQWRTYEDFTNLKHIFSSNFPLLMFFVNIG
jgi:gamma-glutamyltranspeptidase